MIAALKASERRNGVGDWGRAREVSSPSLRVLIENWLLALLVAVTLACGVAAGVTVNHAPAYADDSGDGY